MIYLIVLDTTQIQYNFDDIHRFITTSPQIKDWWHYLPATYIIDTALDAKRMSDSFISAYPGLTHFIVKLDLSDFNGILPKQAWTWIQNKVKTRLGFKPSPTNPSGLSDLFRSANPPKSDYGDLFKFLSNKTNEDTQK